jgi:hypothetical protein
VKVIADESGVADTVVSVPARLHGNDVALLVEAGLSCIARVS